MLDVGQLMLAVIPARGGSRGIPGKNLKLLRGKPLLLHVADTLRAVPDVKQIVVSTDSNEIASVARLHGLDVIDRPAELAADDTPVASVLDHAATVLSWAGRTGLFQPTVPCLTVDTIRAGIDELRTGHWDSVGFVARERHLLWDERGPLYKERLNRQYSDGYDRELGAFLTRDPHRMVGQRHRRFIVPDAEAVDIDTYTDFEAARHLLGRKTIEFRFVANDKIGTGHLRRCRQLAQELGHHDITFEPAPADLVVFDKLDTTAEEVAKVKADGAIAVTLEDLGPGTVHADLVINELYDDHRSNVLSGPKWAVLRPEFCALPPYEVRADGRRVLIVFGGTDPARLTGRVGPLCPAGTRLLQAGEPVAEAMRSVDLLVCSAGRMAHEAAAVGVPCITIAANEREARHSHCPGIVRLGLHATLSNEEIHNAINRVLSSPDLRQEMSATARAAVDGLGGRRIAHRIESLVEGL